MKWTFTNTTFIQFTNHEIESALLSEALHDDYLFNSIINDYVINLDDYVSAMRFDKPCNLKTSKKNIERNFNNKPDEQQKEKDKSSEKETKDDEQKSDTNDTDECLLNLLKRLLEV